MLSLRFWWQKLFGGPGFITYYPAGLRPPPFFNCGTKTQSQVHDAILANTGQRVGLLGDQMFQVTTREALENYASWWRRQHFWMTYQPEWRDCDDFAAAFHGDLAKWDGWSATPNAIVWSSYLGGHAYNIHIALESLEDPALRVYLIEPQTGEVEEVAAEHFEQYKPWLFMVNGKIGGQAEVKHGVEDLE